MKEIGYLEQKLQNPFKTLKIEGLEEGFGGSNSKLKRWENRRREGNGTKEARQEREGVRGWYAGTSNWP